MNEGVELVSGIKVVSLVCAFIGGALGISYTPEITTRMAFGAMVAAIVCGGAAPATVAWVFNIQPPPVVNYVIAVVFGIGGMVIVPGIITAWKAIAADPWGFVDRVMSVVRGGKGGKPDNKDGGTP